MKKYHNVPQVYILDKSQMTIGMPIWCVGSGGNRELMKPNFVGNLYFLDHSVKNQHEFEYNEGFFVYSRNSRRGYMSYQDHNVTPNMYNDWYLCDSEEKAQIIYNYMQGIDMNNGPTPLEANGAKPVDYTKATKTVRGQSVNIWGTSPRKDYIFGEIYGDFGIFPCIWDHLGKHAFGSDNDLAEPIDHLGTFNNLPILDQQRLLVLLAQKQKVSAIRYYRNIGYHRDTILIPLFEAKEFCEYIRDNHPALKEA